MLKNLIFALLLLQTQALQSQTLTPYLSLGGSKELYANPDNNEPIQLANNRLSHTFVVGAGLGLEWGQRKWRFHPQLGYDLRGTRHQSSSTIFQNLREHYLDLALPLRWHPTAGRFYLELGPIFGLGLNVTEKINPFVKTSYRPPAEVLAMGGLGYRLPFGSGNIVLGVRYLHGLTPLSKNKMNIYSSDAYSWAFHRCFNVMVGYVIPKQHAD